MDTKSSDEMNENPVKWLNFIATPEEVENKLGSVLRPVKTTLAIALPPVSETYPGGLAKHPDTIARERDNLSEVASLLGVRIVSLPKDSPLREHQDSIEVGDFIYLRPGNSPVARLEINGYSVMIIEWMYVVAFRKWDSTLRYEEEKISEILKPTMEVIKSDPTVN